MTPCLKLVPLHQFKKPSMKKILFLGFVAMAVTACSNKMDFSRNELNGDVQGSPESKYEETFEKIFGTPSPDQTWGFGETTVASTRGMTRSVGTYADYRGSLTPEESYQDQQL